MRTIEAPALHRIALLAAGLTLLLSAGASAQQVVVGKFSGGRTGRAARNAVASALTDRGATLESYSFYLQTARRLGFRKSRAFTRRAIRATARRMGLVGVVTGSASRRGGRTRVTVKLHGPNGHLWMKETVPGRRSGLSAQTAADLADQILRHVGPGDAPAADAPLRATQPTPDEDLPAPAAAADTPPVEPAPKPKPQAEDDWGEPVLVMGSDLAPAEAAPASPEPAAAPRPAPPPPPPAPAPDEQPRVHARPALRLHYQDERVDDAWLMVGTAIHLRSGLEPRHTTDAFGGLRFDGRMFLRPFFDRVPWADLGFGVSVDFSLGLAYRYRGEDTWYDASQTQWRIELLYRWAQRVDWVPSFVFKLGVNGTHSSVADGAAFAVDASYVGPHLGVEAVWNLRGPALRTVVGLDVLVAAAGGDLNATGGGVHLFLGLQSVMLGWLQFDMGYDLTYYGFDDSATGSTSDTYHAVLLRFGYAYR